ncbi:MAG: ABC transporter ATP-binding protein [Proteobacteria bacterium]|nr:ABC transporter ATP-binding protein [Pseudomonadota bacterium]
MSLLELEKINKSYNLGAVDVPVLKGVTMKVEKGEYLALMGSSGSGKSTLMNIIGCLDKPSSGSYKIEGEEIHKFDSDMLAYVRNQKFGFIFQNFNLLKKTTAIENVILPLSYAKKSFTKKEAYARGAILLEKVGLADRMHHEPTQLSGGQQQRVAIARALVNNPEIILADEPTGNLDSKTSEEIISMFEELNKKENITILMVTHEAEIGAKADRIVRMSDGVIVS